MPAGFSYYDVLGVDPSASDEQIHAAYRATIIKYHPDVNKAPNATRLAAMLNEAYETIGDAEKRVQYDLSLRSESTRVTSQEAEAESWPLMACDRCEKIFVHLRVAIFYRVWSIVLFSQMNPVGGVLCPHCRSALAWRTALFSALLGPWGVPWGIFYTIRALFAAVRGGELPRAQNAQLLRHQGAAFATRGNMSEAYSNFLRSQRFERAPAVSALLADGTFAGKVELPTTRWSRGQTGAALACLIPFALIFAFFAFAASSDSSRGAEPTATAPAASEDSAAEAKLRGLLKTCNGTAGAPVNAVYDACHEAVANIDGVHDHAKTTLDRETYSFMRSVATLYEGDAAAKLGKDAEARRLFDQGVSTMKYLSANAIQPSLRVKAKQWYDCAASGNCAK